MKKIFFRSAILIALITFGSMAHSITANAVELAPEDKPSSVELNETNTPTAEGIRDASFPTVEVANATKPSDTSDDTNEITIASSETVTINTKTGSDVFAVGNTVSVTSGVNGDVFAAGNTIDITIPDSDVSGSLRLAGNTVTVNAHIKRNALIFGNTVHIGPDAVISGDTHIYASRIVIDGFLAGPATLTGEEVIVNGQLTGKSTITAETATISKDANIQADTDVYSPNTFTVNPLTDGASKITAHKTARDDGRMAGSRAFEFSLWLVSTFFFLILGVLLILLWPQLFERVVKNMQHAPAATWTKGALAFFITPIVILLLCFTLIGIPLAAALMFVYMLSLLLGRLFTGMYLGYELVNEKRFKHKTKQRVAYFVIGYFILSLVMSVPFVGWLIALLAGIWGMGGMIQSMKHKTV